MKSLRLSFAPGPVPGAWGFHQVVGSHRSEVFQEVVAELEERLAVLLGMPRVLLVQGSASAAIEAVLGSIRRDVPVAVVTEGEFSTRATGVLKRSRRNVCSYPAQGGVAYAVQFETARSSLIDDRVLDAVECHLVVDVVSGFPYYRIPSQASAVIVSSSKLLRGAPVMGIIGMRHEFWDVVGESHSEYLDLHRIAQSATAYQTPHTALMPQVYSLLGALRDRRHEPYVEAIPGNSAIVLEAVGAERLVGETCAPVLTLRVRERDALVAYARERGVELYCNRRYAGDTVQVATYSYHTPALYQELSCLLRDGIERGWL